MGVTALVGVQLRPGMERQHFAHNRHGVLVRESNTAGLATAGSGDVLTGIVAAFLSKRVDARLAAVAAATAQGRAAFLAAKPRGLVASDVIEALPQALARD